ncbi:ABC-3 protein [Desulfonatronospira thiodismutans ASO3-1]|uniref:ABC-3 protein n=1 Tax=Desulfonatronospira thiodismutans ASO3-1 TaxID=555779 RepID=D6SMT6_9BACT|nr:metal ABC transporter permease [Desulfonatronospira thiodismutans]EFI35997.1 ABC-3 protein [Desulfonatronospira thiodismutans ASO3-1]
MLEILQYDFMRNALLAGFLVSIACGIIGAMVVVNRLVFISGGIAHASYGGIGLAFFAGFPPSLGAGLAALISALTMGLVSHSRKHRADTVIGVIWAVGMSIGIILLDLTPGYRVDLMSYLFGSILMVPASALWTMAGLSLAITVLVLIFYKDFLAMSHDEEFARAVGVPVTALYFLLLVMVAMTVVMTIQVVGLILVIALLTIPSYIAEKYSSSLKQMMLLAVIISVIFTQTGIWLAYYLDLTTGATVVLVAAAAFIISGLLPGRSIKDKAEHKN